jgi:4-alpha-glucanotransferase
VHDEWGIADGFHDVEGTWHATPEPTRAVLREMMGRPEGGPPLWFVDQGSAHTLLGRCRVVLEDGTDLGDHDALPPSMPIGYHRLQPLDGGPETSLVVAPTRCPAAPVGWGAAAQVYSLWRPDGWGIGDLADVRLLCQHLAERGASVLLLSPLHAPSPTMPQEPSPYFPSSRRWSNPLHIPMSGDAPVGLAGEPGGLIDRDRVWAAKRHALAQRFQVEREGTEWRGWARSQGTELWQFALWNALADRFGPAWRTWPEPFRHPASPRVQDLPTTDRAVAEACEFHAWVQWLADRELAAAANGAGLALIGDLAVGCAADGADAWQHQDLMALGVSVGAPPDPFNAAGQDWGLPPFVPWRLRAAGYAPFVSMVRAAFRHMGGLRIDHAMGLFRQYWVPAGGSPADGAYVRLPAHELLAILRLEAVRAGAFVVGEDLGTVEAGVREALAASGILGTKVWWFDQGCEAWAEANLATVTTHDLPTVEGVRSGTDGSDEMQAALQAAAPGADTVGALAALHSIVARSAARLVLATTDDMAGTGERPNHPGTSGPDTANWRRRLPLATEALLHTDAARAVLGVLRSARPPRVPSADGPPPPV